MQPPFLDETGYESHSVQALRGREGAVAQKWEQRGWELASERRGALRTELTFRRRKPKSLGDHLADVFASFRKLSPNSQLLVAVAIATVLGAVGLGLAFAGDDTTTPVAESSGTPAPSSVVSPPASAISPSAQSPAASTAPSPAKATTTAAVDTSVDALLDRMNAGKSKVGDQFRVKGELFHSELWLTGATGDYSVMLKAHGGSQDLPVLVDEALANDWEDGTKVEMVLKHVVRTINGESTDSWLEVMSAKTL